MGADHLHRHSCDQAGQPGRSLRRQEIFEPRKGSTMINIARVTRIAAAAAAAAAVAPSVSGAPSASAGQRFSDSAVLHLRQRQDHLRQGSDQHGQHAPLGAHRFLVRLQRDQRRHRPAPGPSAARWSASPATAVVETGTVTVNWPAGSGLNPSNASVTLRETSKNGVITVTGTITSGAFTGAPFSLSLVPTTHKGSGSKAHPLKSQSLVNTTPLNVSRNFG